MSVEGFAAIPNWMFRDDSINIYALVVYGALASHTGPGGIHPSRETIAREAHCSVRQVARALVDLEALGVVVRVRRASRIGRATTGYELRPHGRLASDEEYVKVEDSQSLTGEVQDWSDRGSGLRLQTVPLIEEEPFKKSVAQQRSDARGCRISKDWQPSSELMQYAAHKAPSVNVDRETENFVDYWVSKPGSGGVKLDWDATWRTWMRRTHDSNVSRGWRAVDESATGQEWMLR